MGTMILRRLVVNVMLVATIATIFWINTITAPVERGDFDECFNPHTAQVFTANDARCAENPYR